jgi:hypothetical protein
MNEGIVKFICGSIIALSFIAGVCLYSINDRQLMAKNIETAISKGIDPLSVRCSYAVGSDIICVAYAASMQAQHTPSNHGKK